MADTKIQLSSVIPEMTGPELNYIYNEAIRLNSLDDFCPILCPCLWCRMHSGVHWEGVDMSIVCHVPPVFWRVVVGEIVKTVGYEDSVYLVQIILMHDIELNPGPPFYLQFEDAAVVRCLDLFNKHPREMVALLDRLDDPMVVKSIIHIMQSFYQGDALMEIHRATMKETLDLVNTMKALALNSHNIPNRDVLFEYLRNQGMRPVYIKQIVTISEEPINYRYHVGECLKTLTTGCWHLFTNMGGIFGISRNSLRFFPTDDGGRQGYVSTTMSFSWEQPNVGRVSLPSATSLLILRTFQAMDFLTEEAVHNAEAAVLDEVARLDRLSDALRFIALMHDVETNPGPDDMWDDLAFNSLRKRLFRVRRNIIKHSHLMDRKGVERDDFVRNSIRELEDILHCLPASEVSKETNAVREVMGVIDDAVHSTVRSHEVAETLSKAILTYVRSHVSKDTFVTQMDFIRNMRDAVTPELHVDPQLLRAINKLADSIGNPKVDVTAPQLNTFGRMVGGAADSLWSGLMHIMTDPQWRKLGFLVLFAVVRLHTGYPVDVSMHNYILQFLVFLYGFSCEANTQFVAAVAGIDCFCNVVANVRKQFQSQKPQQRKYPPKLEENEDSEEEWDEACNDNFNTEMDITHEDIEKIVEPLLGLVYFTTFKKAAERQSFAGFFKDLSGVSKFKGGVVDAIEWLLRMLSKCVDFITGTFDKKGFLKVGSKFPEIDVLVERVVSLVEESRSPDFPFNAENSSRVFALEKDIEHMLNTGLPRDSHYAEARKVLANIKNRLKELVRKFESLARANDSTRTVPTGLIFTGAPGVGKTFSFKVLIEDVGTKTIPISRLKNFLENPGDEVWTFIPGHNFHDGAKDAHIMLLDEFGVSTDIPGIQDNGVVDLIRMATDNPYPLHRAAIEEKDSTFFHCKLMFLTTNRTHIQGLDSLYNKEAFARRFLTVVLTPKLEFCREGTRDPDIWKRRLADPSELPTDEDGCPDMSIYEFHVWDMLKGKPVGPVYSYAQLVERIIANYRRNEAEFVTSTDFRRKLRYRSLKERFPEGVPEWLTMDTQGNFPGTDDVSEQSFETAMESFPGCEPRSNVITRLRKEIYELGSQLKEYASSWLANEDFQKTLLFGAIIGAAILAWRQFGPVFYQQSGEVKMTNPLRMSRAQRRALRNKMMKASMGEKMDTQSAEITPSLRDVTQSIFRNNLYDIYLRDGKIGHLLFIGKRFALMPQHYYSPLMKAYESDPELTLELKPTTQDIFVSVLWRDIIQPSDGRKPPRKHKGQDYMIVDIPPVVNEKRNIIHHFLSRAIEVRDDRFSVGLMVDWGKNYTIWPTEACPIDGMLLNASDGGPPVHSLEGYIVTNIKTQKGDCGLPYIMCDKHYPLNAIIGIHSGGGSTTNSAYATAVFQEDLKELLNGEVLTDVEERKTDYIVEMANIPQFAVYGEAETVAFPLRSEIKRSPFYGIWGESTMAPSLIRITEVDGQLIDPWENSRKKYCTNSATVNLRVLSDITRGYIVNLFRVSTPLGRNTRMLTFEEAVCGIPGIIDSIPRSTSCGYPYNARGISKKDIFGDKEYFDLNTPLALELRRDCEELLSKLLNGTRVPMIQTDYVKSEKLPREKVKSKQRLYSCGELKWLIVGRMIQGDFLIWVQQNRIKNGVTIGINPYSREWSALVAHVTEFGDNVIPGDQKEFDVRCQPIMFDECSKIVKQFYHDQSECYLTAIDGYYDALKSSIHITMGQDGGAYFYEWLGSLSSGVLVTACIGSMINQLALRYGIVTGLVKKRWGVEHLLLYHSSCSLEAMVGYQDLIENLDYYVKPVTNGDDNLIGVSEAIKHELTQKLVTDGVANIGFIYTDATKTGMLFDQMPIRECTFLKRSFVYDEELSRFIAPLELRSVLEAPYWCGRKAKKVDLVQNVRSSVLELSLHGKKIFNHYAPLMLNALQVEYGEVIFENTYERAYHAILDVDGFYRK